MKYKVLLKELNTLTNEEYKNICFEIIKSYLKIYMS